jgi:hypothetical protein
MSKVVVAYIVAGLGLFGALFASFALTGLGLPAPLPQETAADSAAAGESAKLAPPRPDVYIPLALEPGRTYQLTHDMPIYEERPAVDGVPAATEPRTLPAESMFTAVRTLDSPQGPWFEISINEGDHPRTMYLYGMDMRWKEPNPVHTQDEKSAAARESLIRALRESRLAARPEEAPPPPQPEPREFSQWWADTAERLGGATVANLIVSGVAAGITTALTLGALALLSVFRRQNTWSSPMTDPRAGEVPDEDDPYAFAQAQDDRDGQDDEDRRRS